MLQWTNIFGQFANFLAPNPSHPYLPSRERGTDPNSGARTPGGAKGLWT